MILLFSLFQNTPPFTRTPEQELLLLCIGSMPEAHIIERGRALLAFPFDWEVFLVLAAENGISVSVYSCLKTHFANDVPPDVFEMLHRMSNQGVILSLTIMAELQRYSQRLAAQGIPLLVLKGPVLAHDIYAKPYLRQYSDLDLLVPREHFAAVREIILADGYTRSNLWQVPLPPYAEDFGSDYHEEYTHPDKPYHLELHWSINSILLYSLTDKALWSSLDTIKINGADFLNLPPVDQFLMIAVHGFKHMWMRLRWLCDIDQFVRRYPNIDWAEVLARAEEQGIRRIVLLNLAFAHRLLGTPLPDVFEKAIANEKLIPGMLNFVEMYIFTQSGSWQRRLRYILFFAFGRERVGDKLVYLLQYALSRIAQLQSRLLRGTSFVMLFIAWLLTKPLLNSRRDRINA